MISAVKVRRPYVHAIICEDIREEIGGSSSYIGVMSTAGLAVPSFPQLLQKLAVSVWIVLPADDATEAFTAGLILPNGARIGPLAPIHIEPAPAGPNDDQSRKTVNFIMRMANVLLSCSGAMLVEVVVGKTKFTPAAQHVALQSELPEDLLHAAPAAARPLQ